MCCPPLRTLQRGQSWVYDLNIKQEVEMKSKTSEKMETVGKEEIEFVDDGVREFDIESIGCCTIGFLAFRC